MKKLLVATRNRGKLREIAAILDGLVDEVVSIAEYPDIAETVEDQETFVGNALKKAREAATATGLPVIADDSGLVVDYLSGAPGVYSARFAGEGAGDEANNRKLLELMASAPDDARAAAFVCCMAFVDPSSGVEKTFQGRISGSIINAPRGDDGFGYDPIFLVDEYGKTMSELSLDQKNRISHRGQALSEFCSYLKGI